jgi:putative oxidoreductase
MTQSIPSAEPRLILPPLERIYELGRPLAETAMRVFAGIALIVHGWPKIQNPLGMAGMVEGLGFAPGVFWAPLLAATEFFGGILLVLGLLTRPAAFATTIVLLTTVYAHWVAMGQGWSGAELSILWSTILLYFVMAGGNRFSVDAMIGRQF